MFPNKVTADVESRATMTNDENCNYKMIEPDEKHVDLGHPVADDGNSYCQTTILSNANSNFKKLKEETIYFETEKTELVEHSDLADDRNRNCRNSASSNNENSNFKKLKKDGKYFESKKTELVGEHSDFTKLITDDRYCDYKNNVTIETPTPSVTMETPIPPDGGWGWVVVFGCFMHFVIEAGLLTSYGVLYVEIMDYLKVDKVAVSWIGSIRSGLYLGIAPFVLPFTKMFSCREITILGSVIVFGSLIVSAYVITLSSLIICLGILQGIGFGLAYATSTFIVNQYFDKKRPIALGFAVCGAAAGQVVYPVLQEYLLKENGLSVTLFLNAALALNLIVCGAVYFPLRGSKSSRKGIGLKSIITCKSDKASNTGISIFRNPLFVAFFFNNVLITTGGFVPLYFIPDLAIRSGFDLNKAAVLISILGISSGFGRVMIGSFAFRISKFRPHFYIILTVISGVLVGVLPLFSNGYGQLAVFVAGYGFTVGGVICLCNVLLVDLFKREYLASSLGYVTLAQGIGGFIGSPIAAGISEIVGSDDVMFYFTGIVFILASILLEIALLICNPSTKSASTTVGDPEKTPLLSHG